MLLAVAGVFLLFTLPNSIYFVLEVTYGFNNQPTSNNFFEWRRFARLKILTILMFQLSDLQHAVNFFIYLLASAKFRRTVFNLCISLTYIILSILTCSKKWQAIPKRQSTRRYDQDFQDLVSHPSASDTTNVVRLSRDARQKSQPAK